MKKINQIIVRWFPVMLWMSIIFWFSSQSAITVVESKPADILIHKLAHVGEYMILYTLLFWAFNGKNARSLIILIMFAISDEIHQYFVPTRECRITDVLIDILGGLTSMTLLYFYFKKTMIKPR